MDTLSSLQAVRLDVCVLCQLKCPICPRTTGETRPLLGNGYLRAEEFRRFLEKNPDIRHIELANFGEVFLHPELPAIFRYAHERGVTLEIDEGANLNNATPEALEALVQHQVALVRCAIDGATQATYERYRVGGNLARVLANIQTINALKQQYHSERPGLTLQFVIFGHNEHEITQIELLAKMLKMKLEYKLNFYTHWNPVQDRERVRLLVGYADRDEYTQAVHTHYMNTQCAEMWLRPQINWDGKLLGCSRNFWIAYADDALHGNLIETVNRENIRYARRMLMGLEAPREDIPCHRCGVYREMCKYGTWITTEILAEKAQALRERGIPSE